MKLFWDKIALGIMLTLMILGWLIAPDYGLGWDEPYAKERGDQNWQFIKTRDPSVFDSAVLNRGVSFELILSGAADILIPQANSKEIFILRHRITFMVFSIGGFIFYLLIKKQSNKPVLAITGMLMYYLSPRQFAHGFFNSKDAVFMVVFLGAMLSLQHLMERVSWKKIVLHAFISAVAIGINFWGVVLIPMSITYLFLSGYITKKTDAQTLLHGGIYTFTSIVFTIMIWPYSWQAPIQILSNAIIKTAGFSNRYLVLFGGELLFSDNLPSSYIPTLMALTIPLGYLIFGVIGIFLAATKVHKSRKTMNKNDLFLVVSLSWLLGPIGAVIIKQNNLYDGWRHLYFVYPAVLFFAVYMFERIRATHIKQVATILLGLQMITILSSLYRLHPYQNVYFNPLAGSLSTARQNYDFDYWGLSYRQGLESLLALDETETFTVKADNLAGEYAAYMLSPDQNRRINFVDSIDDADYFITNYRAHPEIYIELGEPFYSLSVQETRLLSIYKLSI